MDQYCTDQDNEKPLKPKWLKLTLTELCKSNLTSFPVVLCIISMSWYLLHKAGVLSAGMWYALTLH